MLLLSDSKSIDGMFLAGALALAACLHAGGQVSAQEASDADTYEFYADDLPVTGGPSCVNVAHVAALVMEVRQEGLPMDVTMDASQGDAVVEAITRRAYERPFILSEEQRLEEVKRFSDEMFALCMATISGAPTRPGTIARD